MYIKKIFIESFGKFTDYSVDLTDGFNLIYGSNEAGKSTISSFISFILYGFERNEKQYAVSFSGFDPSGYLIVSKDGDDYRISRRKAVRNDIIEIIMLRDNSEVNISVSPGEYFLGVPYSLFKKSSYISQKDGSYFDYKDASNSLENLLFSADDEVNVERAVKKLESYRTTLLHKNGKGGIIFEQKEEIERLQNELDISSEKNNEVILLNNKLQGINRDIDDRSYKIKVLDLMKKYRQIKEKSDLFSFINDCNKKVRTLNEKLSSLTSSAKSSSGFLPNEEYLTKLTFLRDRFEKATEEKIKNEEKYSNLVEEERKYEKDYEVCHKLDEIGGREKAEKVIHGQRIKTNILKAISIICLVITLLLCGATIYFNVVLGNALYGKYLLAATIVSLVITIVMFILYAGSENKFRIYLQSFDVISLKQFEQLLDEYEEKRQMLVVLSENVDLYEEKVKSSKNECHDIEMEIQSMLSQWDKLNIDSAIVDCENYLRAKSAVIGELSEIKTAICARQPLLEGYDEFAVEKWLNGIKTECEKSGINVDDYDSDRIDKEYDFYSRAVNVLSEQKSKIEKEYIEKSSGLNNPAEICDKLEKLRADYRKRITDFKALSLAISKLILASENMKNNVTPRLVSNAEKYLSKGTGGKYGKLMFDTNMSLSYLDEENTARNADFLSAGTSDCVYLALRFSLSELIYQGKKGIMIFDESFSRLDENRMENVLDMICGFSSDGNQTILFTSQIREVEYLKGKNDKIINIKNV